ncbi:MAG: EAL domain-containing protein [Hyphomonadaceae bacterium]|nr:EAL domain-containing protein [Hyphomonadaceae bacterium]
MRAAFFILYLACGAGAAYGAHTYLAQDWIISGGGGALAALLLGQAHLFLFSGRDRSADARADEVMAAQESTSRRVNVLEARTDAVETTLKHELTERRDALVAEMKQLEGLIERLTVNVESQKTVNGSSTPSPMRGDDPVLRDVRGALEENRVDLHLQPVVSLPQRRVSFYEGLARLRREDGSLIMPAEFTDAARRARLLGMIEALTLFRCVQIVRRLIDRDRRVGVFCNISAGTLEDTQFFPFMLDFMSEYQSLSGAVIFEMPADAFVQRSREMRENMDKLVSMGFRFSLDQAASLDLDLPRLQDAGIRFVKFAGGDLVDQLRDPAGPRPTSSIMAQIKGEDVSAVFSRYGITMIGEKLEDEATVLDVLEYDVPFGQGHVFGSPRPIKASLMEETAPPQDFTRRMSAFG